MTNKQRRAIEAAAWARHCEQNWPVMLGCAIATVVKMTGKHWIHTKHTGPYNGVPSVDRNGNVQ